MTSFYLRSASVFAWALELSALALPSSTQSPFKQTKQSFEYPFDLTSIHPFTTQAPAFSPAYHQMTYQPLA